MLFLYDLPNWMMGVLIVGACMGVMVGGYLLIRRRIRTVFTDAQVGAALAFLGVLATVTSLLLAFSAVSVWESFNTAESSVTAEANEAAQLARDLAVYGPEAFPTREALRGYLRLAVDKEWPLLTRAESSAEAWNQLDEIFREAARIEPTSPRQEVLMGEIWARINALTRSRRDRMHASQASVPGTLWTVVLAGSVLTFAMTLVLPLSRFSVTLVACLAASMGLVFFFIVAMDHPFAGAEAVGSGPLQSTLANMQRWDEAAQKSLIGPPKRG